MNNIQKSVLLSALISLNTVVVAQEKNDVDTLKKEAISIVKKFGGALKPELKKAMQAGGPVNAMDVCSIKAPEIAANISKETGWEVKRVSLKPRGANATPDAWETKVLTKFDERQAGGESAKKMAFAEKVDGNFRFMKAQGVDTICLSCHATEVKPEVEAKLKALYPNDKARGYKLGQIRGAFSLTKKLP